MTPEVKKISSGNPRQVFPYKVVSNTLDDWREFTLLCQIQVPKFSDTYLLSGISLLIVRYLYLSGHSSALKFDGHNNIAENEDKYHNH
jgi:hypothetical protein